MGKAQNNKILKSNLVEMNHPQAEIIIFGVKKNYQVIKAKVKMIVFILIKQ